MNPTRRSILRTLAAAPAAAALAPWSASAQSAYPTRPVRVIVPYAAGGGTDFFARLAFGAMGEQLGQQFVIENKPGAGTNIGAESAARAEPDGYTLLLGDTATFATNRTLYRKLSFDPTKDFTPISLTGRFALVLLVNTNKLPVKSIRELVAEAKKNPGRINYATPGLGSPFHLATELLSQAAGIKLTHVPYRGAAPAVQDLVAGQVDMMFIDFATARSQLSGPIQAIAVASPKEFSGLPGVPPVAADHPGFEAWAWQGFVAPANTPAEIVSKLNDTYRRVVANAEIRDKLIGAGIDVLQSSPAEMAAYMQDEGAKWEKVIRTANITLE
ncbi:tripartite tricarboxylate transporter substrate binding protein [Microvirga terrae]|uniref:Tripartite tricarboxylate transporter substrate binding protein n=1 Tax=Microvirga terrae TaxID=2740529 RepID=A0ABY5RSS1_9HYPH|nr:MULTISPECIES: tripartite tricarboxylate transporter substrate binding protein [Microvirga]MBQ0824575.1 tripartite tricarboxylate transporter substrate binding protein [Microvirga sp. HBU67558]UVF19369.1 tripartite tricarboxylate transporter substrate binding protein [Microvirga terrae]